MAQYLIEDSETGRKLRIEGDSPPTPEEMEQLFAGLPEKKAPRVVNQIAEFAGGANRTIMGALDVVPNAINEGLNLLGSQRRVPTLLGDSFGNKGVVQDAVGQTGDFVGRGTEANILSGMGNVAAMSVGAGAVLRGAAGALNPANQSAAAGTLRAMGGTTPVADATMGAVSGAGQEIGREMGGDTGALIGGIAAPMLAGIPAAGAGAVRGIFRGNNAQGVQNAVDDAAKAGTTLTAGQATGNRTVQAAENISSKLAGGGPLADAAEKSTADIQSRLSQIADNISTTRGNEAAGRVIKDSITGRNGFVDRFKTQSSAMWNEVDNAIGPQTPVKADSTRRILNELVSNDEFASILNNPKVAQLKEAFDSSPGPVEFERLRQLRSTIGARLGGTDLVSDIPRAELKRLYGAMSDDIGAATQAVSPEAARAFTRANNYTRAGHSRIDGFIENVMGKAEFDKIFSAVTKGGEGSQTINAFKRSMNPEEWEVVVSNVVRNMGKATAGQQGADAAEFSVNKFLTDWNKLGPAKRSLFAGSRTLDHYGRDLEAIARTAERIKFSQRAGSNPSGTGQFTANTSTGVGLAASLGTGNLPVFTGILGAIAANAAGSRLMTNPRFVSWLAGTSKAQTQDLGAQLTKLAAIQKSMPLEDAEAVNGFIQQLNEQGAE